MKLSASAIVIMGISGCGKSTLGQRLANVTGYIFTEGDDLHTPESIGKMSAGRPLTDEDRWPWLERVARVLRGERGGSGAVKPGCIVSCSALKRSYRDMLRSCVGDDLLFVYPKVSIELAQSRLKSRPGHYMPSSLLESQVATLEVPTSGENVLTIDGSASLARSVDLVMGFLSLPSEINTPATPD